MAVLAVSWSKHITGESYHFFQGKPVLSFDPEGLVFSVGVQSEQVESNFRFISRTELLKYNFDTGEVVRFTIFRKRTVHHV